MSDQNEVPKQPAPVSTAAPAAPAAPRLDMTQADLDRIVGNARTQARTKAESSFGNQLTELGFEDGLAGLQAARAAEAQAVQDSLVANNKWEQLHQNAAAALVAEQAKVIALQNSQRQSQLQNALLGAAKDTVNPQHVSQLLAAQMKQDEVGNFYSETSAGIRIGLEDTMANFLTVNPYLLKPAPGRGANNPGADVLPPEPIDGEKFDAQRAMTDPEYLKLWTQS